MLGNFQIFLKKIGPTAYLHKSLLNRGVDEDYLK